MFVMNAETKSKIHDKDSNFDFDDLNPEFTDQG